MNNLDKVKEHLYASMIIIVILTVLSTLKVPIAGTSFFNLFLALIVGTAVGALFASPLAILTFFVCYRNNKLAKYILIGVFIFSVIINLYIAFFTIFTLPLGAALITGMLFGSVIWLR